MAAGVTSTLPLLLLLVAPVGRGQVNNNNLPIQRDIYYLDSNADCNGPVWQLNGQTARVIGHGAIQEQQGPTSCTLTLRSQANFEHTNLLLQVVAVNIHDCDVNLVLYDGDPGQNTLRGYDCRSSSKPNERNFITTGDIVSFMLTRQNTISTKYDIEIKVIPLVSGTKPGYENDYGDTWGYFREKLENNIAIGIVGAAFILTIILVTIAIIVCYRRYLGVNKPWERHQLSTFRPAHSIYETKSKMSDTSSDVWASNMSRGHAEPPRRRIEPSGRMAQPSEDEDSVFDDASDIAPKKYLMDQDRRMERQRERERERERERHRGRGRDFGTNNSSYVQADDDHPQDTYVERVIEPRVRTRRLYKPPSYDEAINETETEKSDVDEEEDDDSDKKETSEEESEEASSEEEDEEEEAEDGNTVAPTPAPRTKAQPAPPANAAPLQPGAQPPAAYPGYPPMGYMGSYPMAPGQFVPIVAAPPAQPFPPTGAGVGPGYPPPQYPGQQPPRSVQPSDPPIYSYLVQRGYTPLDPSQEGPSSQNTSHSQASLDDMDRNALASGVEYMRR